MSRIILILLVVMASGCTAKAEISEEDKNKTMSCKDTRDGERFSFRTNDITDIRAGLGAPTSMSIVTLKGKKMTVTSSMEAWLKCEEVENVN